MRTGVFGVFGLGVPISPNSFYTCLLHKHIYRQWQSPTKRTDHNRTTATAPTAPIAPSPQERCQTASLGNLSHSSAPEKAGTSRIATNSTHHRPPSPTSPYPPCTTHSSLSLHPPPDWSTCTPYFPYLSHTFFCGIPTNELISSPSSTLTRDTPTHPLTRIPY